ncbi:MAG: integrase core domain-containing protein [Steroidobacteraceae bacterium]
MLTAFVRRIRGIVAGIARHMRAAVREATWPTPVLAGLVADALRSRDELIAENALLRQQLIVAARAKTRPTFKPRERALIVFWASVARRWQSAVLLVRPATVLRWHRHGFRLFWRWRSRRRRATEPRVAPETVELIRTMARDNRLWGAERIRGELLKLGIRVAKRTVQKFMRSAHPRRPSGQSWATFLRNHLHQIWACDFLQTYDIWFRPLFAFFIIELGSRRVVSVGVTPNPSSAWVAQQLRNATPFGAGPRFILRDRDDKYGSDFDRVVRGVSGRILKTPVRAPKANAFCERFLGSVRRECLDHMLVLGERQLLEIVVEYVRYFDQARPHQGIGQLVPAGSSTAASGRGAVVARPVLSGLHHDYRRAA